jgi:phage tail protein X
MMKMKACKANFGVAEVKPIGLKNVGYKANFGVAEVKPVQLNQHSLYS